jgi:hypothetical protein
MNEGAAAFSLAASGKSTATASEGSASASEIIFFS